MMFMCDMEIPCICVYELMQPNLPLSYAFVYIAAVLLLVL